MSFIFFGDPEAVVPDAFVPFVPPPRLIWAAWTAPLPLPLRPRGVAPVAFTDTGDIYRVPVEEYFGWQRPVLAFLADPPLSPAKGDRYIVLPPATGAWGSREGALAWFDGSVWRFDVPVPGCGVFDITTATFYFSIAGVWTPY